MKPKLDPKKLALKDGALRELLDTHRSVFIHADTRKPGVLLPTALLKRPQVVIELGYSLPVPVRDMRIDDRGLSATISIARTPTPIFLPWGSVFLIVGDSGYGNVWQVDVPPEVTIQRASVPPTSGVIGDALLDKAAKAKTLPPWCKGVIDGGKKD